MNGRRWIVALLIFLAAAVPGSGETCGENQVSDPQPIIFQVLFPNLAAKAVVISEMVDSVKKDTTTAEQDGAPSSTSGGTSLVDGASFANVWKTAFEDDLIGSADGQVTIDLNLFAFKALADRGLLIDQVRYEKSSTLRRFGGVGRGLALLEQRRLALRPRAARSPRSPRIFDQPSRG